MDPSPLSNYTLVAYSPCPAMCFTRSLGNMLVWGVFYSSGIEDTADLTNAQGVHSLAKKFLSSRSIKRTVIAKFPSGDNL